MKKDGKFAFKYDNAGNLTDKGNISLATINGDQVTFGTPVANDEYWHYTYDLLNRLTKVEKNGTLIAKYEYDPVGLRVVKKTPGETVHYVFQGTEPIYEKNVTTGRVKSYVYAFGKHLARVDGVIGDSQAKKYWYSTDQVGSVRAVTDETGTKVWDADYLAFGQQYAKNKIDPNFEEDEFAFTGKGFDAETGLYYFNARWYDQETGRFISEDPVGDPNNPNLYSYCRNNPLTLVDPMGLKSDDIQRPTPPKAEKPQPPPPSTIDGGNRPRGQNASQDQEYANKYFYRSWEQIYNYYSLLKSYNDPNWKAQFLAQYLDLWANLPSDFYKDPTALLSTLNMMNLGIDAGGQSYMPGYGWGMDLGAPGLHSFHTDIASMNMVRAIQAALGVKVDGQYGIQTLGALKKLGLKGNLVGQRTVNALSRRLEQSINCDYIWPTAGRLSSRFGPRTPPVWYENGVRKQGSAYHQGIDIANTKGTDIDAFGDGTVIFAGWATGNTVVIDHGNGLYSYYFHLDSYSVEVRDYVSTGQYIADMGNTGGGTGPHLHFAISTSGQMFSGYVDPLNYLP
ncbi:MAG TPA: peptidoglycan DD-metalloendopeptidase family protein [Bacillota bacterium]|nr:peptidoglycan DD-metalloendopeptidase family protein [Bacillota bacterium]